MSRPAIFKPGVYSSSTVSTGRTADPSAAFYAAAIFRNRIHDTWGRQTFSKGVDLAVELIQEQRRNPQPPSQT
jgi:hypothetical protein